MDLMIQGMARLRHSIALYEESKGPGTNRLRRNIQKQHGFLFFFIGMALNLNLDTSLLTSKVFRVENFANVTLFLYFGTVLGVTVSYMFLINPQFYQLVASLWLLLISRICHLLLALYATGKSGRNWFLVFYTLNGFLRGVISLSSTYVISKMFVNQSYLHFNNGGPFFSILLSLVQLICDKLIGTKTVRQYRLSLIIAQSLYVLETIVPTLWITVFFITYGSNDMIKGAETGKFYDHEKSDKAVKKFGYTKYYPSKLIIVFFSSLFRVVFHPVLIPYFMDIEDHYKLFASIIFTTFEFLGRLLALNQNEYIDPSGKSPNRSHEFYLVFQDLYLYFWLLFQLIVCILCLYSSWYQKYGLSTSPYFVTFVTLSSGFVSGYADNRAIAGSQAVLKYYNQVKNSQGATQGAGGAGNGITPQVVADTSNVNDILTLADYASYLIGSSFSYFVQSVITSHKETIKFIIASKRKYMDVESLNRILNQMNY